MIFEDVADRSFFGQPKRFVERADEEGLDNLAVFFPNAERDRVTFRLLQDEAGNIKQRVSAAGHLDLAGQRFDADFFGNERNVDFDRRGRGFTTDFFPARSALIAIERRALIPFTTRAAARSATALLSKLASTAATTTGARAIAT
ncbi:MAG: hypothetical protein ACTHLW_11970, partial [Verrucomicrobiota bacterium]